MSSEPLLISYHNRIVLSLSLAVAAAMCDRRHRRLTLKAEQMKEAAIKALQTGNDKDARKLLEVSILSS